MRLISLKLHNIRSYSQAKLEFPTGIVLLSGDIGSGKSSILLGIEFALFGVLRGELSGNALLRMGSNEGSVELTFELDEKKYTIKRTLKRTKKSVEQSSGYVIEDGVKKEATAVELKSYIINLLGYPPELLTKSKNFVYRYTVYSPQEEMKRILLENKDDRVALLRKVFGIDKYERITQNAAGYAKSLRERKRALDALLVDTKEKEKQLEETKKEHEKNEEILKVVTPAIETTRSQLVEAKKKVEELEKQREQAEILTRGVQVTKIQFNSKDQLLKQVLADVETVTRQLVETKAELPEIDETVEEKSKLLNTQLIEKEKVLKNASINIAELNAIKKQSSDTTQKIGQLAKCPTCLQNVTQDHKHQIIEVEQKKIGEINNTLMEHTSVSRQAEQETITLKRDLEELRIKEKEIAVARIRKTHIEILTQRRKKLDEQSSELQKETGEMTEKLCELEDLLQPLKDVNNIYTEFKKQLDFRTEQERNLSIKHSTLMQKQEHFIQTIERLQKELEQKGKARKQLERTQHVHQWITDYFVPVIDVIEKHVMAKIHHEFDALFQQWFSVLVEDRLQARLDETFTPIIEQNGYDIHVEYLSGGERTACALAYRLALNKTINSLISTIKTKDLLILDEPTEGFSTEQLDKMRDVLAQLHLNQTIIVSHEQKIESFADSVIRVEKAEHTSQVG